MSQVKSRYDHEPLLTLDIGSICSCSLTLRTSKGAVSSLQIPPDTEPARRLSFGDTMSAMTREGHHCQVAPSPDNRTKGELLSMLLVQGRQIMMQYLELDHGKLIIKDHYVCI